MAGKPVQPPPLLVLKRVEAAAAEQGWKLKAGVECGFFTIIPDGSAISDGADKPKNPCYDQSEVSVPRRCAGACRSAMCSEQSNGEQLQTHQRSHDTALRDLVTCGGNNRTHMIRIPDAGLVRTSPRQRRGRSVSTGGWTAGGRNVWDRVKPRTWRAA
jgi:glutamine synthetase